MDAYQLGLPLLGLFILGGDARIELALFVLLDLGVDGLSQSRKELGRLDVSKCWGGSKQWGLEATYIVVRW